MYLTKVSMFNCFFSECCEASVLDEMFTRYTLYVSRVTKIISMIKDNVKFLKSYGRGLNKRF